MICWYREKFGGIDFDDKSNFQNLIEKRLLLKLAAFKCLSV